MRNSRQSWETESITLQRKTNANKHKKHKMMHMGKIQPWLYITEGFQTDCSPMQHLDIMVSQISLN